ncbi:MAG TPA: hypothetical protein VGF99_02250 [Myxococcota bacterium]
MTPRLLLSLVPLTLLGCRAPSTETKTVVTTTETTTTTPGSSATTSAVPSAATGAANATAKEGVDDVVLERRRFLDETGVDQPVEAFSVLLPRSFTAPAA